MTAHLEASINQKRKKYFLTHQLAKAKHFQLFFKDYLINHIG
jgi:hypothetical protein